MYAYVNAIGIFLIAVITMLIVRGVLIQRLKAIAKRTGSKLDDIVIEGINQLQWPFYIAMPVYISSLSLNFPENIKKVLTTLALITLIFYAIRFFQGIIIHAIQTFVFKQEDDPKVNGSLKSLLNVFVKIVLWSLGFLLIAQNIGFNVTALLGGLGIGGVAIAFALQKTLEDFFAFFSIYFDKPFEVGDFISTGTDMGTVEQIGVKSTRLKSLKGDELILPNSDLMATRINNFRKMEKRRIAMNIGVTYETESTKLRKIPVIIEKIINDQKETEFDRAHLKEFGDSALMFEVVFYINSSDYAVYMEAQQQINLQLIEAFTNEKINFAYPTQHLFVQNIE